MSRTFELNYWSCVTQCMDTFLGPRFWLKWADLRFPAAEMRVMLLCWKTLTVCFGLRASWWRSSRILGSCFSLMVRKWVILTGVCITADTLLDYCSEKGAEFESRSSQFNSCSNPHLWPWTLGNDQKNEIAATAEMSFLCRVSSVTLQTSKMSRDESYWWFRQHINMHPGSLAVEVFQVHITGRRSQGRPKTHSGGIPAGLWTSWNLPGGAGASS